ncbi:MAG: hypothetical protein ACJAY8_000415 [Sphingobacteriales bacterium]|jgi:uncharacterized protein (TIGR00369 family)
MEEFRTVDFSKTVLSELMVPNYANFGGKVHGGVLLSLMDKVAYACATKHAGNYCVTVSVDGVDFINPVEVGDQLNLMASVNFVGRSSLVVGIRVEAENIKTREIRHTNSSYFTMVAIGENKKPAPVAGLLLTDQKEIRRFVEANYRKKLKEQKDLSLAELKLEMRMGNMEELLRDCNCKLA